MSFRTEFLACCSQQVTIYQVERCNGGDVLQGSWVVEAIVERDHGVTVSQTNQANVSTTVVYIAGDEPFLCDVNSNLVGHYLEYSPCPGVSEFYSIDRFIEGLDFTCCVVDHYECELRAVCKPQACVL